MSVCMGMLDDSMLNVACLAVAYNLEVKPSPIAASLKFRHSSKSAQEAAEAMPGPADYNAISRDICGCNTVKGYTMGQRSA